MVEFDVCGSGNRIKKVEGGGGWWLCLVIINWVGWGYKFDGRSL